MNSRKMFIPESELIVNKDGSIYHLSLKEEHIADDVIVVGDQDRVEKISSRFDKIEFKRNHREFFTHTGYYKGKRLTVLSHGIGTDNIDIVLNELDAAVNVDLQTREIKENKRSLNIVRLGTSGSLQEDIPVDSFLISEYAFGFDGLVHFYEGESSNDEHELEEAFIKHTQWNPNRARPYVRKADQSLMDKIGEGMFKGITVTATGFYGPQGRELRLPTTTKDFAQSMGSFTYGDKRITNFEMETSGIYALGNLLGHKCCTACAIIANRITNEFSKDHEKTINNLIDNTLHKLTT